jgi:hypothetical protein
VSASGLIRWHLLFPFQKNFHTIALPVGKIVVSLPRFFQVFQCDGKLKEAFLQTKTLILSNTTN